MSRVNHEFGPFYDQESEILILGSIPSPKSREVGFYYTHPQNRFWKVIALLYEEKEPITVKEKKMFLKKHKIALWDVVSSCEIKGASDNSIKDVIPNDINWLLEKTNIKKIFSTGKKATDLYQKYCFPQTGVKSIYLPSTSPANCAMTIEELISFYQLIKE